LAVVSVLDEASRRTAVTIVGVSIIARFKLVERSVTAGVVVARFGDDALATYEEN
jgi:hypothetical protein